MSLETISNFLCLAVVCLNTEECQLLYFRFNNPFKVFMTNLKIYTTLPIFSKQTKKLNTKIH